MVKTCSCKHMQDHKQNLFNIFFKQLISSADLMYTTIKKAAKIVNKIR